LSERRLRDLARTLGTAWDEATAVAAPTSVEPSLTIEDAYAIQELIIAARLDQGRALAGWKMGLTSAEPPATPIVGTLLSDMVVQSGSALDLRSMVMPMVEAELVVRVGERIDRPQNVAELEQGPHEVGPGLEVIDYRTIDSKGVIDWIADNSTVAYAVVGEMTPVSDVVMAEVESTIYVDGTGLASGRANQVMGNPLAAVSWLSKHLAGRGHPLEEGQVVLTGSLTGHHTLPPDRPSEVTAEFGVLGAVSVSFLI
jgi:2-keto-4-pentenoate hydratase